MCKTLGMHLKLNLQEKQDCRVFVADIVLWSEFRFSPFISYYKPKA